jgi:ribosomal protein S17
MAVHASQAKSLTAIVVSAGRMQRAVKVQTTKQCFNSFLQKHFRSRSTHLVSDPTDALRIGDVIRIEPLPFAKSRRIRHVVSEIITPFGPRIDERPPIPSAEERAERHRAKRAAKLERRRLRREAGVTGEGNEGETSPGAIKGNAAKGGVTQGLAERGSIVDGSDGKSTQNASETAEGGKGGEMPKPDTSDTVFEPEKREEDVAGRLGDLRI